MNGFPGAVRGALAVAAAAMLSGCPLSSDTPLSDPGSAAPDSALVGTWQTRDPETGEVNDLRILAFNEHEMVAVAPESGPGTISAMRVFCTPVGAETFLNIQELGSDRPGWFFASYRVENNGLRLRIVDDELFKDRTFASSRELRAFLARNLADPRLYGDTPAEMILERVPDHVPEPSGASGPES